MFYNSSIEKNSKVKVKGTGRNTSAYFYAKEVGNMDEFTEGRLKSYCEFVQRGKPTAMLPVQDRYVEEAIKDIQYSNLLFCIEKVSDGWKTVWIYKEKYMLEIIRELPEHPKTIFEHWVLGKAFGYSEQSIEEFLLTNQLLHK